MKKILIFFIIINAVIFGKKDYEGYWINHDGKIILKIEENLDKKYSGHIVWIKDLYYSEEEKNKGIEQYDRNNPDKKLRTKERKIRGLKIIGDLQEEDNKLKNGWFYDPWKGRYYHLKIRKRKSQNIIILRNSIDKFGVLGFNRTLNRVRYLEKYNIIKLEENTEN